MILGIQHEHGTGPGLIGERIEEAGLKLDLRHPYQGEPLPADLSAHSGLIVLGGTPGAGDVALAPWLPAVEELLREAVRDEVPVLGVCLGGQLLATACGGTVTVAPAAQVGLHPLGPYPAASDDELFAGFPDDGRAVQWHWDEITTLPPGAVPLLRDGAFPHQAFRLGRRAWGVQFHPEVLLGSASEWASGDSPQLAALGLDVPAMLGRIAEAEPSLRALWGGITDRWLALVREPA
ncbi:type 1 glutamine amidotransferase [Nonomuraea mangrovi]|uniref:Type 1 glutamine amidotransferase n=1 Tax=Nonomuraea mangrovi TaxID=2316207 RepID=A0ABW4SZD9_9ACTN